MAQVLFTAHYTLDDIDNAAQHFWNKLGNYRIFAFSGEMGAGKTTFIHHLCDYLQVEDAVSSPTFALINEYHFSSGGSDRLIYHMDWYRLRDTSEAISTGMDDCIAQAGTERAWCFIEWPEKAMALLAPPCVWVAIESLSHTERRLTASLM